MKGKVVAGIGILFIGMGIGNAQSQPTPDARVVTIPKYKTHVVTETVDKYHPLPETCVRAADVLDGITDETSIIGDASGKTQHSAVQAAREAGSMPSNRDLTQLNEAITAIRASKDKIDTASIALSEREAQFVQAYKSCQEAIQDGPE